MGAEWRTYRDLRLRALLDSPDAFGSTHEREAARTDADWRDGLAAGLADVGQLPLVALSGETPIGLAWGRVDAHDPTVAHLFQVWVAPDRRGRGIGRLLTEAAIAWARDLGVRALRLGVTPSHPAALQLYRRAGFVDAGDPEPLRPGSSVMCRPMELSLEIGAPERSHEERGS